MNKLSLCLTVHNRPPDVSAQVAAALRLPGNQPDELILVLDRTTPEAKQGALDAYSELPFPVRTITIPGDPEWLCPARAWNHAFLAVSHPITMPISSEVVLDPGAVDKAKELAQDLTAAIFGSCHNSTPEQLVNGAEPGLLVSSKMPRPLGFIAAIPTKNIQQINGFDEAFMQGLWYDDDDFFARLWHSGLDFHFIDSIHGIHLDHPRPVLSTDAGIAKTVLNGNLMLKKHGTSFVWNSLPRITTYGLGVTKWTHL